MTLRKGLALDRSPSNRTYDQDGRLHLAAGNPISKATVSPYMGHEIPDYESLGWLPDRVYYLLRDPEELAKAAPTFNNLPILARHIPVSVDAPRQDLVIGTTGTDSVFEAPYLTNSLAFWTAEAIDKIETDDEKELSSAYYYRVDPTPGEYEGLRFDGIMRDIVGNHVALVKEGRAGPDVVVGDSAANLEIVGMAKTKFGMMLAGALVAYASPKLAQDAKIDFGKLTEDLKPKGFDKTAFAGKVKLALDGKLAKDADIDDVVQLLDKLEGIADDPAMDEDDSDDEDKDDDPAMDEDGDPDAPDKPECGAKKPAQDAARLAKDAADAAVARVEAIYQAREEVAPVIGKLAKDAKIKSDADVYKMALDHMKVDLTGVPAAAYGATFRAVHAATAERPATPRIAQDSAGQADYDKKYGASRLMAS